MNKRFGIRALAFGIFAVGVVMLAGCSAGGSTGTGSGDWFYHWKCNGDSQ
jgi:hypothetical protein